MRILTASLLIGIIIAVGVTSQVAWGDSHSSGRLAVLVVDRHALDQSEGEGDLTLSVASLISTLGHEQGFAFIGTDDPSEILGPLSASEMGTRALQERVRAWLSAPATSNEADLLGGLAASYNLLGSSRAAPGSTVYLVASGAGEVDAAREVDRLSPTVGLFRSSGWPIVALALPSISPTGEQWLSAISSSSGGEVIALSIPDGFRDLSNRILGGRANGSLSALSDGILSTDDVLTSTLDVAPGTREATLLFFKEGRYGSLRLSGPSGVEASAGEGVSAAAAETPHVVIWKLFDPAPGVWQVNVSGIEGVVSAWRHEVNRYSLALLSYGAVPVGQPSTIIAFAEDGQQRVVLSGVAVTARITAPGGAVLVHDLNDAGVEGDSVAGDGYFSALIPPVGAEGDYRVDLELKWPDAGRQVSSRSSFAAQVFPTIDVTPLQTGDLTPGERSKVATAMVHVQGEPYAVSVEALGSSLAADTANTGVVEVAPQQTLEQGRAWLYDVYFTPGDKALHTLNISLAMEYAGRRYTHISRDVVLSSLGPPAPPALALVVPPTTPLPQPRGFPWGLLAIPIVAAAAIVVGALYRATRVVPYGYLYDDRNEPAADFANLRRRFLKRLLSRDRIQGAELGLPGLESVSFKFFRRRIGLTSRDDTPSVRVNNQPLLGEAPIRDRAWIGARGWLYSFTTSPRDPQPRPAPADD